MYPSVLNVQRVAIRRSPPVAHRPSALRDRRYRAVGAESGQRLIILHLRSQVQLRGRTYPLLGQLARAFIFAISEELNDTTLIGSEPISLMSMNFSAIAHITATFAFSIRTAKNKAKHIPRDLFDDFTHKLGSLAQVTFGARNAWFELAWCDFLVTMSATKLRWLVRLCVKRRRYTHMTFV